MHNPRFDLVGSDGGAAQDREEIARRYAAERQSTLQGDARKYFASPGLASAINVSLATNRPLLLTGEPGTGKTLAAYYIAERFELGDVLHFQAKSDSKHTDVLYEFDAVAYLRDAYVEGAKAVTDHTPQAAQLTRKEDYVEQRELWEAFDSEVPRVLLVDEIDKAPRDFPNDLLMEFDRARFSIRETGQTVNARMRPIIVITSNSERYLPDAFLRRCVFHHLELTRDVLRRALSCHRDEFEQVSDGLIDLAIRKLFELRALGLQRAPATSEAIIWLKVLNVAESSPERIEAAIDRLKYIETLVKTIDDLSIVRREMADIIETN